MNLGIAVVYLVDEGNAALLDLHLHQIEKCTRIPYTIYACTNRLAENLSARLDQDPHIKIIDCPKTEKRNAEEHSHYLERLVQAAVEDGASHIVTLHVDSFPIRAGWAESLAEQLATEHPLAALEYGPYTACLFFCRDFYLDYRPHFLLSDDEQASPSYAGFSALYRHILHSGIGYLFRAYTAGLNWHPLTESNAGLSQGVVYANSVFHLHGSARLQANSARANDRAALRVGSILQSGHALARKILPAGARQYLWEHFGDSLSQLDKWALAYTKRQIFRDSDRYIETILERHSVK
jgi:hypothetical protein